MKPKLTSFTFALLIIWLCCAGVVAKPIHHYVFFSMDREKIKDAKSFLETDAFEGAQVGYSWNQLEQGKDNYDFSMIREDLAFLTSITRSSGSSSWTPAPATSTFLCRAISCATRNTTAALTENIFGKKATKNTPPLRVGRRGVGTQQCESDFKNCYWRWEKNLMERSKESICKKLLVR